MPTATPPAEAPSAGRSDLLLGAGAEFEGKLTFRGTVRIDAVFKGTIVTNDVLVVGEHARIDAEIACGSVIVHGQVRGNVRAKDTVEIHRNAQVRGDVDTGTLTLEKGGLLEGTVHMAPGPRATPVPVARP